MVSWRQIGNSRGVLEHLFANGKVGHAVRLERSWLALYDGVIVGRSNTEVRACRAVEERNELDERNVHG